MPTHANDAASRPEGATERVQDAFKPVLEDELSAEQRLAAQKLEAGEPPMQPFSEFVAGPSRYKRSRAS